MTMQGAGTAPVIGDASIFFWSLAGLSRAQADAFRSLTMTAHTPVVPALSRDP